MRLKGRERRERQAWSRRRNHLEQQDGEGLGKCLGRGSKGSVPMQTATVGTAPLPQPSVRNTLCPSVHPPVLRMGLTAQPLATAAPSSSHRDRVRAVCARGESTGSTCCGGAGCQRSGAVCSSAQVH